MQNQLDSKTGRLASQEEKRALNVGIVFAGRFPWNRGIGQLYDLLECLGHKPLVLSRVAERRYANQDDIQLRVVRLRTNDSLLARIKSYPVATNYFWKNFVLKNALKYSFDSLIARETQVLPQCVMVAKKLNIPCFVDMRENLAFMYNTTKVGKNLNLFHNQRYISYIEAKYLRQSNHIFTVSEELKSWVLDQYGLNEEQVSVLGNYPDSQFLGRAQRVNAKRTRDKETTTKMVYAGAIKESKGIQDIIKSLPAALEKYECHLTVIGDGTYVRKLKELVRRLSVEKNVTFKPLMPPEELPEELAKYDIGICPYFLNEFTHQTMPGKLFEYMAVGLPVFSSARKPVVRIIQREKNGIIYNARDVQEISTKLISMIENVEERHNMGRNGRAAVLEKYNYTTSQKMLKQILVREMHKNINRSNSKSTM